MKYAISFVLACFLFIGCSKEPGLPKPAVPGALSYAVLLKNTVSDTIYSLKYAFDGEGNVLSERFTNYKNPQHNYVSTFQYDRKGRVVAEIRNGVVFREIVWSNGRAKAYDSQNRLIAEFKFDDSRIISYTLHHSNDLVQTRYLDYDPDGNVISIADENGVYVEYLDYDTAISNPLSLIHSITILRIDYKPHFKHVFRTEKVHPYQGDDYSQPLMHYAYDWTLNVHGQVVTMEDEKTLIYTHVFAYE